MGRPRSAARLRRGRPRSYLCLRASSRRRGQCWACLCRTALALPASIRLEWPRFPPPCRRVRKLARLPVTGRPYPARATAHRGSSVMMAYKPLRLVSRHASILGPSQPLQIVKENAGNADSSRARSVRISVGVASFRWQRGPQRQQRVHADGASLGRPLLRLADPACTCGCREWPHPLLHRLPCRQPQTAESSANPCPRTWRLPACRRSPG